MKLHLPFCLTVLLNTAQLVFVWYIENENHFVKTHNYHSISSLKIKSKHTQMTKTQPSGCLVMLFM